MIWFAIGICAAFFVGALGGFFAAQAIAAGKSEAIAAQLANASSECVDLRQAARDSAIGEAEAKADLRAANAKAERADIECQAANRKYDAVSAELKTVEQEKSDLQGTVSALNSTVESKDRELAQQKQWIVEQGQHLQTLFSTTADRLLNEKSEKFGNENKVQIENLLKPFRDQIGDFRQRVDQIHTDEVNARGELRGKIETLASAAVDVGSKADRLADAMLGNSKHQGEWGQAQLTRLLETAGFIEGTHFTNQLSGKNDDNERRIADTVLHLPNDGTLVIDAKVSLPSWLAFCEARTPEEMDQALQQMVASIKAHYLGLSKKDYAHVVGKGRSLPFTIMFVPIEPAALHVLRAAPDLLNDARRKNVIILTPTSLFGMLQLVNAIWGFHDKQTNALAIAEQGRLLLSKLNSFLNTFLAIGNSLESATESFQTAKGQLSTGRGHLIGVAGRMASLGVEAPTKGGLLAMIDEANKSGDAEVIPMPQLVSSEDRGS